MYNRTFLKTICFLFLLCIISISQTNAQTSTTCSAPGNTVVTDNSEILNLPQNDIQKISVAEPVFSDGADKLVFTLKVKQLFPLPLSSWNVFFTANGTTRFVQMSTLLGSPMFRYGTVSSLLGIPIFNYQGNIEGNYTNDGTIVFYIDKSRIGNPPDGEIFSVTGRVYINTLGIGLVQVDDTPAGNYTLVGNEDCAPVLIGQWGMSGDIPVQHNYLRNETDDFAVWRPSSGVWYADDTLSDQTTAVQWGSGNLGDIPVPGNFDHDGKADYVVYRPQEGNWYMLTTETNTTQVINFGLDEDIPVAGDYDGDRVDDIAVFRPSSGVWYIMNSLDSSVRAVQFGLSEDRPLRGDFDGDRQNDLAIFRPVSGAWYIWLSDSNSLRGVFFGNGTDVAVPADYDGDDKTDVAVWRPETGFWFILKSGSNSVSTFQWGLTNDIPVPGDYNGNGRADIAVFRPTGGIWYAFHN